MILKKVCLYLIGFCRKNLTLLIVDRNISSVTVLQAMDWLHQQ